MDISGLLQPFTIIYKEFLAHIWTQVFNLIGCNTGQSWGQSLSLGFVSLGSQTHKLSKSMIKVKKRAKTK